MVPSVSLSEFRHGGPWRAGDPAGGGCTRGTPVVAGRSGAARLAVTAFTSVALVAGLTSCAAGQQAQTTKVYSSIDGINANIGAMALRDVGISAPPSLSGYAAKGTAALTMAIANQGPGADQLTSVSSPAATSVKITPPAGGAAPAASSAPAGGTPAGGTIIAVPPQGLVQVGSGQGSARIALSGLTAPLISGQVIAVTFTFRNAGTKTIQLPVRLPADYTGGETISVSPSGA